VRLLTTRYPGALSAAPPVDSERLIPNHALFFRLLVGLSADGRWMQFSQTSERLWQAFLRVTELDLMLEQPEYHDAPNSEDPAVRVAFWEQALTNMRDGIVGQEMAYGKFGHRSDFLGRRSPI